MATAAAPREAADGSARAAILGATERLLQDESLDELSVAQILTAANVSRATFYFYFASKDDAFIALLAGFMDTFVPRFEAIVGDVERRRDPALLREDIAAWLAIEPPHEVIVRSAVEEWPRRAELQAVYLAGQRRLSKALAKAIDQDRKAGVALASIPSAQLAAGWMWTMERSWYEAVGGATHMRDLPAVRDALAATLVAAIYGR
ncbi:TetR/AcrR family transcriptional regulator [Paraconexibacter sp. AEG42_29]|uniref:TetR/AcrR family transcriptional regulator n=1 Tax=Paraconexibacter sp. AEG42_29 TaxID=2997339 RepID=UPI00339D6400